MTVTTEITCEVQGPGKLLGLESGDSRSHEFYTAHHRKAYHGKLLGYIQSTKLKCDITVTVSAPGLGSKTLDIRTR